MYRYKKIINLVIIIFLVLADQYSKYMIRTQGGFYICNTDIAFGLKLSYSLTILIILALIIFFLFLAGNYKSKIANSKQIKNHNVQNSPPEADQPMAEKWFWILDFGDWNLFRICNFEFGALILIAAGGISNLIDRAYLGCVIDFIDLKIWPVFNLADIYITIGAIILIFFYVFKSPFSRHHRS